MYMYMSGGLIRTLLLLVPFRCIASGLCFVLFSKVLYLFLIELKKKTNIKVGAYHRRVLNEDDNLKKKRPYIYFERLHGYGWLIQA